MLRVEGLSAWYGQTQALFGASLSVRKGETLALVGTNGAGKTTLVRSILGLVRSAGEISIDGRDVQRIPPHRRGRELAMAVVPEGRGMFSSLTVKENLELGYGRLGPHDRAMIERSFERISDRIDDRVSNLSGGEQQMVALCRAFLRQPRLLIMDEPSLGLAPVIVDRVYEYLTTAQRQGATVLLVEQDVERARAASDQMSFITAGTITGSAPTDDVSAIDRFVDATFADVD